MTVRSAGPPGPTSPTRDAPQGNRGSWFPGYLWWLPLIIASIAGAVVYIVSAGENYVFEAEAILWVPPTVTAAPELYAQGVASDLVLADTIATLRLETTTEELRAAIDIEVEGTLIFLRGRATESRGARILLDGIIDRSTDSGRPLVAGQPPPVVTRRPLDPSEPLGDDAGRNAAVTVALSLVAGLAVAALVSRREYQHQPVLPIESVTRWPVLGVVPRESDIQLARASAASYERLHESLERHRRRLGFRTLLVTGVGGSADIADVALNTARAYAASGLATLIVDASMDVPRLHQLTHVSNDRGLSDALRDDRYPPFGPLIATQDRLWVMPRGPAYAIDTATLSTPQATRVLEGLPHAADLVILVGPSLDEATFATTLASHCHATMVAIGAVFDDDEALQHAADALDSPRIRVVGAVVTRASTRISARFNERNASVPGSNSPSDGPSLGLTSWAYPSTSAPQHDALTLGSVDIQTRPDSLSSRDQP